MAEAVTARTMIGRGIFNLPMDNGFVEVGRQVSMPILAVASLIPSMTTRGPAESNSEAPRSRCYTLTFVNARRHHGTTSAALANRVKIARRVWPSAPYETRDQYDFGGVSGYDPAH